ncbi:unnamed protein product, partial [Allacma fusca]
SSVTQRRSQWVTTFNEDKHF